MHSEHQSQPIERFAKFVAADFDGRNAEADRLAKDIVELDGMPPDFIDFRRKLAAYRASLRARRGWPKLHDEANQCRHLIEKWRDVRTVASVTGKSPRTVRRWIAGKLLYAHWDGTRWKIPAFQFTKEGAEIVPGIPVVNQMLTGQLDPLVVCEWFQARHPDLCVHGEPLSPIEWLLAGKPPTSLACGLIALHIGPN